MILSALSFLAGIVLVQQFPQLPSNQWLVKITLCAGIMAWLRY